MASNYPKIRPGNFAHICNREIGNELLFRRKEDYSDWMAGIENYLIPIADIHAFCLMSNHYHLVLQTHETTSQDFLSNRIGTYKALTVKISMGYTSGKVVCL
jgi:putative transposase